MKKKLIKFVDSIRKNGLKAQREGLDAQERDYSTNRNSNVRGSNLVEMVGSTN